MQQHTRPRQCLSTVAAVLGVDARTAVADDERADRRTRSALTLPLLPADVHSHVGRAVRLNVRIQSDPAPASSYAASIAPHCNLAEGRFVRPSALGIGVRRRPCQADSVRFIGPIRCHR